MSNALRGLIAEVERKNGWQVAEHAGSAHPRGMQRVLARYAGDAEAVRDDLRTDVVAALGDPDAVLVLVETGFPKQNAHSAGVARQYCGTLGKIAPCQVGAFLGYASPRGHTGIDRALRAAGVGGGSAALPGDRAGCLAAAQLRRGHPGTAVVRLGLDPPAPRGARGLGPRLAGRPASHPPRSNTVSV